MKAVVCTRYGPPEVLQVGERATPVLRNDEIRIRILATAVTSSDCYVRGLDLGVAYKLMARLALGWSAPRQPVLGMVLSGVVDAVGPGASRFDVGERVFGFDRHRFGTYAEYVCWPADGSLTTRPADLTDAEAAAIPYGGLLALAYLRKAGVRVGQRVLVYGASGAVGTSVGRRKSAAALRRCRRVLAHGGACISVDDGTPKLRRDDLVLLGELATKGELRPVIDRIYSLDEIVEAHAYVDTGHKRGNVVVAVA